MVPGLVIDFDASLVTCHSEKQGAAPTFKHGFGYHPLLVWLDNTDEALAGMLRPGNAGANTAADHIQVTDEAFGADPRRDRHGSRSWSARRRRRHQGMADPPPSAAATQRAWTCRSRSGSPSPTRSRTPSRCCPETAWTVAVDAAGEPRPVDESGLPVAQVAELTGLLPGLTAAGWPEGMRVLVRRERPHPGAQISVFEAHDGWRYQCLATDTPAGQLPFLEARHRAHARVEDRVKAIKQTGMGRFPSREFTINAVWLQLALTAADLIAWTQTILLARSAGQGRAEDSCATGCCTPPPGSSAADAGPSDQDRHRLALGRPSSPPRSPDSPRSDNPCWPDRQPALPTHQPRTQENRTPGRPHPHAVRPKINNP